MSLTDVDPDFHGDWKSVDDAQADLDKNLGRISQLQRKLYASRNDSLLVVLQGIDGAGKDGACWHVIKAMDPQGVNVVGFKQPTPEKRTTTFYGASIRTRRQAAASRSSTALIMRTLVARVHRLVPKDVWKARFDFINEWKSCSLPTTTRRS